ncbi:MAG: extracellular solute-binding protein [Pseudomonadota bacterium]
MDVLDQLGAMREGKMSRRAFTKSLLAAGVATATVPLGSQKARASGEQGTFFTWGGYDDAGFFDSYVAKNGDTPDFAVFGASEEALTKIRGGFVVDVAHPCNSGMPRWAQTGLFQPIDTTRVEGFSDLIPSLVDLPGNEAEDGKVWMVPWDWGQTSITYRTDLFELEGEESWDMLWDQRYAGKLGSIGSGGDAWWCGAIKAGVKFEDLDTEEAFEKISAVMREQRPLIRTYTDDMTTLQQAIASGEMVAAMTWNDSATLLINEGHPVKFASPKEGALTWTCGAMIHKDAPNPDRAYDIISSLITVESGKYMIGEFGLGHSNARAFEEFSDEKLTELGLSRKPEDILSAGHFQIPMTQDWETRMNETFEQIKAGF